MFFKKYDFNDLSYLSYTSILSGEIGSGKTSFVVELLLHLLKNGINIKTVYVNIDGFNFEAFNKLSDVKFKWLDMTHFINFSKEERESYTKHNSSGHGIIAKNVEKDLGEDYDYFNSLIICDEADHYLTKKNDEYSNFLKFRRHYGIGIIFITQKFQNLDSSYYNSGAINRFYRIRNPLFNFGDFRFIELWSSSNTNVSDNMVETTSFKISELAYEMYDVGANINKSSLFRKKLIPLIIFLVIFIPISFYFLSSTYNNFTENSEVVESNAKKIINTSFVSSPKTILIDNDRAIIKCVYFGNFINCYHDGLSTTLKTNHLLKLFDLNISIEKKFENEHTIFLEVPYASFVYFDFVSISKKGVKDD